MVAEKVSEKVAANLCLVVVGSEAETRAALHYASMVAKRIGGEVALFGAAQSPQAMYWLVVEDASVEETHAEMERHMKALARVVEKDSGVKPRVFLRHGGLDESLMAFMQEHKPLVVIMGSKPGHQQAGELITSLQEKADKPLNVPIIIISPEMKHQDIEIIA